MYRCKACNKLVERRLRYIVRHAIVVGNRMEICKGSGTIDEDPFKEEKRICTAEKCLGNSHIDLQGKEQRYT